MDDKEIEVNGKTFEKIYLENVIKMCEKCFTNLDIFRMNFCNFFWFYGLKEENCNKLIKHLDGMKDILLEYYSDLNKTREENDD